MNKTAIVKDINVLTMLASSKLLLLKKLEKCMNELKTEFAKNEDFDVNVFVAEQQHCITDIDKFDAHFKNILSSMDEDKRTIIDSIVNNSYSQSLSNWSDRLNQTITEQRVILLSLQAINNNNVARAEKISSQAKEKLKQEKQKKCIQDTYLNNSVFFAGTAIGTNEEPLYKPVLSIV